jgi:hypothetical protein
MEISAKRATLAAAVVTGCAVVLGSAPAGAARNDHVTDDCIELKDLTLVNQVKLTDGTERNIEKGIPFKHFGPIYDAKGKKVGWDEGRGVLYLNPKTGKGKEMVWTTSSFKDGSFFSATTVTEEDRQGAGPGFTEEVAGSSGRFRGYVGTRTITWKGTPPFDPLKPQPYAFTFKGCKVKRATTTS